MFAIFIVAFFVVFFWAAYEQAGSSMNLFADRNTDLTLGGLVSKPIPASWFQSVNPAYILIFSPVFAWIWMTLGKHKLEPSTAMKMVIGLFLLGTGFVFMVFGAKGADQGTARELDSGSAPRTSATPWANSASRRSACRT